jgi:hypothetical protein
MGVLKQTGDFQINCELCGKRKNFWKLYITTDTLKIETYCCGPCLRKAENDIYRKYPEASIHEEKMGLLDLRKNPSHHEQMRRITIDQLNRRLTR